jgi:hypothetical protein
MLPFFFDLVVWLLYVTNDILVTTFCQVTNLYLVSKYGIIKVLLKE